MILNQQPAFVLAEHLHPVIRADRRLAFSRTRIIVPRPQINLSALIRQKRRHLCAQCIPLRPVITESGRHVSVFPRLLQRLGQIFIADIAHILQQSHIRVAVGKAQQPGVMHPLQLHPVVGRQPETVLPFIFIITRLSNPRLRHIGIPCVGDGLPHSLPVRR